MSVILVVAAHPDDEVLGCGGTLARHADEGDSVRLLFLTDGVSARPGAGAAERARRAAAARAAAVVLGAETPVFLDYPDNRLDSVPLLDVIRPIEAVMREVRPAIVYTHHGGDLNVDHRIAHQAVLTACRPLPGSPVRAIHAFESGSSTEWSSPAMGPPFVPQRFVAINPWFERKLAALNCYAEELRPFPHARSLEAITALARVRGATAGLGLAEGFMVIRDLVV